MVTGEQTGKEEEGGRRESRKGVWTRWKEKNMKEENKTGPACSSCKLQGVRC